MKRWKRFCCLMSLLMLCWLPGEAKQMAVVVDKSNSVVNMAAADLAKVLQANTKKWPDGKNITVVFPELSSNDLQQALQRLFKMTPDEVKTFLVSHKNSFVAADSPEALLKLVESTPGAIGL